MPPSPASVAALHAALRARLERRATRLMDEVRRYPGPIARCDEQLSALIEQRAAVFQVLERLAREAAEGRVDEDAASLAALAGCLESGEEDADLRERLDALRDAWRARRGGCGPADLWTNDGGTVAC